MPPNPQLDPSFTLVIQGKSYTASYSAVGAMVRVVNGGRPYEMPRTPGASLAADARQALFEQVVRRGLGTPDGE